MLTLKPSMICISVLVFERQNQAGYGLKQHIVYTSSPS